MKLVRYLLAMTATLAAAPVLSAPPYASELALLVQPQIEKPAVGQTFVGADFGASITRLSDSTTRPTLYDGGSYTKNDYSRVQVENSDGSKLLLLSTNSNNLMQYAIANIDGSELSLIALPSDNIAELDILHDETEARWHPANPAVIRFIKGQNSYVGGLKVYEYNWQTQQVSVLADLEGKLPAKWGNNLYGMTHLEGEYSADGNRLAWSIENSKEKTVGYVAFDLREGGIVLGSKDYDGRDHNNLGISPSGRYLVISSSDATSYFPVDFSSEHIIGGEAQHGDFCVTAEGKDCYITVSFDDQQDPHWGWVFSTELETGARTALLNVWDLGNTSMHFSGRGFDAQGWALISTYNCHMGNPLTTATHLCSRNMLVELKADPKVYTLNWNHATGETYYSEPHATMSRDAKRVYYSSDWMNKTGSVDLYRLDIDPETFAGISPYVAPINPLPPEAVTLLSPDDNAQLDAELPVLLSFEPHSSAQAASSYDVHLINDKTGEVILKMEKVAAADICLTTRCDVQLDAGTLSAKSNYSWRASANTSEGRSLWGQRSFSTASSEAIKPARVTTLSPEHKSILEVQQALEFGWTAAAAPNSASALTHFRLQLIMAPGKSTVLDVKVPISSCVDNVCRYIAPDNLELPEGKKHTWKIQAVNSAGVSKVAQAKFSLTDSTRVKPGPASALSPEPAGQVVAGETLTLSWQAPTAPNAASVATQYDLVLFDRVKRSRVVNLKKVDASLLCNESGHCSYSSDSTVVSAGKKHWWKVRAINAKGRSKWTKAKFDVQ